MMFRAAILAFVATSAHAEAIPPIEICATVSNDDNRLSCFDRITDATIADNSLTGWQVASEVDPITDATRTTFSTSATTVPACGIGRERPRLELICAEHTNTWFVRIRQNCNLPLKDDLNFLTRHDRAEATSRKFTEAAHRNHLQLAVAPAQDLIQKLIGTERFLIRIEPSGDYPVTLEFPVSGLAPMLTESGAGCKL